MADIDLSPEEREALKEMIRESIARAILFELETSDYDYLMSLPKHRPGKVPVGLS